MGRGEKSLICDPGSELRLGGREKNGEDSERDEEKNVLYVHMHVSYVVDTGIVHILAE